MNNKKGVDVNAILEEMKLSRNQVCDEIVESQQNPLILDDIEFSDFSLEELIESLEEEEDIIFNI